MARRDAAELRSVTLLARAAAHEINNPLAVIMGYLQLLAPRAPVDSREAYWVRQTLDASARIRDAVARLNSLIRIETVKPGPGELLPMLDTEKSSAPAPGVVPPPEAPP